MTIAFDLLHTDQEIPCPECEYPIWVLWSEMVAQVTVRCSCCRRRVRLLDENGSIQNLGAQLEQQISQLVGGLSQ